MHTVSREKKLIILISRSRRRSCLICFVFILKIENNKFTTTNNKENLWKKNYKRKPKIQLQQHNTTQHSTTSNNQMTANVWKESVKIRK